MEYDFFLDDFSNWSTPKALRNFEISSNMAKNWEENEEISCSIWVQPTFFGLSFGPSSLYARNKTAGAGTCLVAFFCNVGIPV